MKCLICETETEHGHRDVEYRSLPGTLLVNVPTYTCPSCGEDYVSIPHIAELNRSLALEIIRQPRRLRPAEIVFLRKHLGWSARELAERMGANASTVSRWEHGKQKMGLQTERLLRLLAYQLAPVEDYAILDEIATYGSEEEQSIPHPVWRYSGCWRAVA